MIARKTLILLALVALTAYVPAYSEAETVGIKLPQKQVVASPSDCSQVKTTDFSLLAPVPGAGSRTSYKMPSKGKIVSAKVQLGSGVSCFDHDLDGNYESSPVVFDNYQLLVLSSSGSSSNRRTSATNMVTLYPNRVNKVAKLNLSVKKGNVVALSNSNNKNTFPVLVPTGPGDRVLLGEFNRGASASPYGGLPFSLPQSLAGYLIAVNVEFIPSILPKLKTPTRARGSGNLLRFGFSQPGSVKRTMFTLYRRSGSKCFALRSYSKRRKVAGIDRRKSKCAFTSKRLKWFKTRLQGKNGSFLIEQPLRKGTYFAALRATAPDGYTTKTYLKKQNMIKFAVL